MKYFISGHLDITDGEFREYYIPKIDQAIAMPDAKFVIGDARGIDSMAQKYLKYKNITDVTVYHLYEKPRNNCGFPCKGKYMSDESRDNAMTTSSDQDIAWVRPVEEQKKLYGKKYRHKRISGTEKNLNRRQKLHDKEGPGYATISYIEVSRGDTFYGGVYICKKCKKQINYDFRRPKNLTCEDCEPNNTSYEYPGRDKEWSKMYDDLTKNGE